MEEEKQEVEWCENILNKLEEEIKSINEIGVENIEYLSELVDIHKDLSNEKYWKEKIDIMYGNYGNYGEYSEGSYGRRGVPGTGRGRYREGSYGRRGVPGSGRGRYRGEEMIDEMKYHYGNYQESYNNGNYSAKEDSAYKMTEAFKEFGFSIAEELEPNEKMMFKKAMQEIMQELEQ